MKTRRSEIFLILTSIVVSVALALIMPVCNGIRFLSILPNILGILLSGTLASLAIIFGLLSSKDLSQLKVDFRKDGRDLYLNFVRKTKLDAKIIFFSLAMSTFIFVIYDIELSRDILDIQKRVFFALGLIILTFSLSAIYDIVISLFYLNELRYELSNEKQE